MAVLLLCGCSTKEKKITDYDTVLAATIVHGEDSWALYKCYNEQLVLVVKDDKIIKTIDASVKRDEASVMTLPNVNEDTGYDITSNKSYTGCIWKASLEQSAQYVEYLLHNGYSVITQANMQSYIDMYLYNKGANEYKRIVIDCNNIVIKDITSYRFKSIDNYLNDIGGN